MRTPRQLDKRSALKARNGKCARDGPREIMVGSIRQSNCQYGPEARAGQPVLPAQTFTGLAPGLANEKSRQAWGDPARVLCLN